MTLLSLGKDAYSTDPADLAAAEARLMGIRPYVRYINAEPLLADLAGGQICVAVTWNGIAVRGKIEGAFANPFEDGFDLLKNRQRAFIGLRDLLHRHA